MCQKKSENRSCLYLGDLSTSCTEDILREDFSEYGNITRLELNKNKVGKKTICFALLTYESLESASRAMDEMSNRKICGRPIK